MGTSVVMDLVFEEIQRTVAEYAEENGVLWASNAARQIKDAYPGCALTEQQIEDLVVGSAMRAGVAVRFGQDWHDVPYSAGTSERL